MDMRFSRNYPIVIMMCGIQGSGKTTYAKFIQSIIGQCTSYSPTYLSCDDYRQTTNNEQKAWQRFYADLKKEIEGGWSVIVDNTNILAKWRKEIIDAVKSCSNGYNYRFILINVCTPLETCIKRQEFRERKVPREVIERYYKMKETPIENEGFIKIYDIEG